MPDRETVVKVLEHCEFHLSKACLDCPYSKHNSLCLEAIKADAIALLRGKDKTANNPPFQRHDCGALIVYRGRDVCPNCGRKVDWND